MKYEDNSAEALLAESAIQLYWLEGEGEWNLPEGSDEDEIEAGITLANVDSVDMIEPGRYVVTGMFDSRRVVDRIPAGPNRGYGPINPPEVVTEEMEVEFWIEVDIENDMSARLSVEGC